MNINIPTNNYKPITKVRENVVQYICDVFLNGGTFHPFSCGRGRSKTTLIESAINSNTKFRCFTNDGYFGSFSNQNYIRIYKCEVEAAIKALLEHGWFLHLRYQYNEWDSYIISKYPNIEGFKRVNDIEFDDSFDA